MALRERNALVLRVQGAERAHALDLHVHVRAQDLAHFNEDVALGGGAAVQHLLELLDADAAFQALVKELDRLGSTYEPDARGKAAAEIHQLPTARMKAQWQLAERHGLGNVLERVAPVRHSADASEMTLSGAYRPLPMRKVAVTVWLYPPTTEIPPTGDPIPKNSESVHDFFPSDSE